MPKVRKATDIEKARYRDTVPRPLYPLYGFVKIDGTACAVEDLRGEWSRPDPIYEIMAPKGKHFRDEGTHTLLCVSLADVAERASGVRLTDCTERCG